MEIVIKKFDHVLVYRNEQKKLIKLQGYSFLDSNGNCMIIAYGEERRDFLKKRICG